MQRSDVVSSCNQRPRYRNRNRVREHASLATVPSRPIGDSAVKQCLERINNWIPGGNNSSEGKICRLQAEGLLTGGKLRYMMLPTGIYRLPYWITHPFSCTIWSNSVALAAPRHRGNSWQAVPQAVRITCQLSSSMGLDSPMRHPISPAVSATICPMGSRIRSGLTRDRAVPRGTPSLLQGAYASTVGTTNNVPLAALVRQ